MAAMKTTESRDRAMVTRCRALECEQLEMTRETWIVPGRLTDVDVSLDGEDEGEPDAGVVEHLGCRLGQHFEQEARGPAPVHIPVTRAEFCEFSIETQSPYLLNV